MRERLNKIPDYGAGLSTSNEEMVTEPAGEPADLGEMLVDDVEVLFYSGDQKYCTTTMWLHRVSHANGLRDRKSVV